MDQWPLICTLTKDRTQNLLVHRGCFYHLAILIDFSNIKPILHS